MKMNKFISLIASMFLLLTFSAKAEMGIGVTGAYHMLGGDGSETTRQSGEVNNGSIDENVAIPEIFLEAVADSGLAVGFSYVPARELGSKSRTDSNSDGDSGTYRAEAELENVVQLYFDFPLSEVQGFPVHGKVAVQHVTLKTLESLNSGATYPNKNVFGYTIGLGAKGDVPYGNNLYYKGELTYTNFETYDADGAGNRVKADLEDTALRLSLGYKF